MTRSQRPGRTRQTASTFASVCIGATIVYFASMPPPALGATTERLQNVSSRTHEAPKGSSLADIERAIYQGALEAGWYLSHAREGKLVLSISVHGKHRATVAVEFDAERYRIDYVESENLDFDPDGIVERDTRPKKMRRSPRERGPVIHRNYNLWVLHLSDRIASRIADPIPERFVFAGQSRSSVADELEKLDALRERGVLTEAEFQAQKQKLLDR